MTPQFSVLFTTVRPQCVWAKLRTWGLTASNPTTIEFIVATDTADTATERAVKHAILDLENYAIKHVIQPDPDGDCVKGWNTAAKHATAPIMVQISDDFTPPMNWDTSLLALKCTCAKSTPWWEHDHAVHVDDMFVNHIMTLGIITRARYQRYGYYFYPEYKSMFCDTELTEVAYRDGVVIDARAGLSFEHHHYNRSHRTCDPVDIKHGGGERWNSGETLFNSRKACGFPPLGCSS